MCTETSYLSNSLPFHNKCLHFGEVMIVGDYISDDGLLIWILCVYIWMAENGFE